jgi:uncharacterized protein YciI
MTLVEIISQPTYFVALFTTKFRSMEEVQAKAPRDLAEHVSRSKELGKKGKVLMAGAFLSGPGEIVTTMAVFYSRQDAEEYVKGDPFVSKGMVSEWQVKEWNNMLKD